MFVAIKVDLLLWLKAYWCNSYSGVVVPRPAEVTDDCGLRSHGGAMCLRTLTGSGRSVSQESNEHYFTAVDYCLSNLVLLPKELSNSRTLKENSV